jgi:hypothetical protein
LDLLDLTPEKYDICNPIAVVDGVNTGKKTQVRKSTNFDAGMYDIKGFLWALIISTYQSSVVDTKSALFGT